MHLSFYFFFSSRRRHTRSKRDWSSACALPILLMICDGEKSIGIAGIMGGENSMITDHVHTVLFEAACFDGTNIRKSSKRVGLRTDASGKFEKGLDPNNAKAAIDRACQLVEEMGAGEVVGGTVDVYGKVKERSEESR